MEPLTIIAIASAVMQGIQTWISIRDRPESYPLLIESVRGRYETVIESGVAKEEANTLQNLVPKPILSKMEERVKRCWDRYMAVIDQQGEYFEEEVDEATDAVIQCLCRELRRIWKLNKRIPDGTLDEWWEGYCMSGGYKLKDSDAIHGPEYKKGEDLITN